MVRFQYLKAGLGFEGLAKKRGWEKFMANMKSPTLSQRGPDAIMAPSGE
jgi:hypothetical protein